jgi:hypothetical protein
LLAYAAAFRKPISDTAVEELNAASASLLAEFELISAPVAALVECSAYSGLVAPVGAEFTYVQSCSSSARPGLTVIRSSTRIIWP